MKEKIHYPTLDEALECADSWEQSTSLSRQAMFRRVGVVLAREVRRLKSRSDPACFPLPYPSRDYGAPLPASHHAAGILRGGEANP